MCGWLIGAWLLPVAITTVFNSISYAIDEKDFRDTWKELCVLTGLSFIPVVGWLFAFAAMFDIHEAIYFRWKHKRPRDPWDDAQIGGN